MPPDRHRPESAAAVLESLIRPADARSTILRLLADDVRHAHDLSPQCWGMTLTESMIRLNVGRIEVLAVFQDRLHLVFDGETAADSMIGSTGLEASPPSRSLYPSVDGSRSVEIPASRITEMLPAFSVAHRALVTKAATTPRNPATAIAHSPGVLRLIEHALGDVLPDPNYPEAARIRIDVLQFEHQFERFLHKVRQVSGEAFTSFRSGLPLEWEDYKERVRIEALSRLGAKSWKRTDIGTGRILEQVIHAIEIDDNRPRLRNNLVAWDGRRGDRSRTHRALRDAGDDAAARRRLEEWFFGFYHGNVSEEGGFERFREIAGSHYDLIAYLYFLKDWERFAPIAATTFDKAFRLLGIPLVTAWKCSWDNYCNYNAALLAIRDELRERDGLSDARLIDAHSFCWMLARLKLNQEPERVHIPLPRPAGPLEPFAFVDGPRVPDEHLDGTVSSAEFEERDASRRRIGRRAEAVALESELLRLRESGRFDRPEDAKLVSDNPRLGYDIRSTEEDGTPRYIEVKAARRSAGRISFLLSDHEWRRSRSLPNYYFYLVFDAESTRPEVEIIEAATLSPPCLAPAVYRATLRRTAST